MIKRLVYGLLPLFGLLAALPASAAMMSVVPDRYNVRSGETFSASVLIDSEGTGINAVQASIQFPAALVEVVKVDSSASSFSYWLDGPAFSNTAGIISFTGGAANGISGKSLQAVNVTFKVKGTGSVQLVFTDGAVTASDGSGTNVLSAMRGASIESSPTNALEMGAKPVTALPPPTQITRPPVIAAKTPVKPIVDVPLYPDQKLWYNAREDFLVVWKLPPDISNVATAIDQDPTSAPQKSEGLFDNKLFRAPKDGVWYVHVRFKNNIGWGETTSYKVSIDTVPPSAFSIEVVQGAATDDPSPTLEFPSGDTISGIDHYDVQDNDNSPVKVASSTYRFPPLAPGTHPLRIWATDRAGNTTDSSLSLIIKPIASPVVTAWNKTAYVGEGGLGIHGTAASGTSIELVVRGPSGESVDKVTTIPDVTGAWRAIFDQPLKAGIYSIEVRARDGRGALSLPIQTGKITVGARPALVILGIPISSTALLLVISLLLLSAFAMGQYLAKRQQTFQMWHSILARRDVSGFLQKVNEDLEKALEKLEKSPVSERSLMEGRRILLDLHERVGSMGKYLLEAIEDITKPTKPKIR